MAKSKVEGLIARFPVTDLALAVTYKGKRRERFLQNFVDQFTTKSWRAVRENAHLIYNAQPPLSALELPKPGWAAIESKIRRSAGRHNEDENVRIAGLLRDLISIRSFEAFQHPEQFVHLAPGKVVKVGLNYYLVERNELIFQFVQPRADARVDGGVARTLMSLVHYAYVFGDFEDGIVEMADLSAMEPKGERVPRFHRLERGSVMERGELNREIDDVHGLLIEIAKRS